MAGSSTAAAAVRQLPRLHRSPATAWRVSARTSAAGPVHAGCPLSCAACRGAPGGGHPRGRPQAGLTREACHDCHAHCGYLTVHQPGSGWTSHPHLPAYRTPAPVCPTRAGSKIGLEVMPIASVTLSDGHGPGERAPTSIWRLAVLSAPVIAGVQIRPFCRASASGAR